MPCPQPAAGRRQQKKQQTRAALSEAALSLFQERGFDAVTLDEISAAAGVSRRTFFRYFDSKEAVFFAPQEARLSAFEARLRAPAGDHPPLDRVVAAVLETAALYHSQRDAMLASHHILAAARGLAAPDQQLDSRWEAAIVETLRPEFGELRAVVFAGAIIGTVRAGLRRWFAAEASFDLVDFGVQAFGYLAEGVPIGVGQPAATPS